MVDLISVSLTDLQVDDAIPQLDAIVTKVTKIKVGRTGVVRNHYVELDNGQVILTTQRIVVKRQSDGRLMLPWKRIDLDYKIGIYRFPKEDSQCPPYHTTVSTVKGGCWR